MRILKSFNYQKGFKNFRLDLSIMLGRKKVYSIFFYYWDACWLLICPALLIVSQLRFEISISNIDLKFDSYFYLKGINCVDFHQYDAYSTWRLQFSLLESHSRTSAVGLDSIWCRILGSWRDNRFFVF